MFVYLDLSCVCIFLTHTYLVIKALSFSQVVHKNYDAFGVQLREPINNASFANMLQSMLKKKGVKSTDLKRWSSKPLKIMLDLIDSQVNRKVSTWSTVFIASELV